MRSFCRSWILPGILLICQPLASAEVKRRILVIPFDNMQQNRNYNWMSDSMAENLKNEFLRTDKFVVMDAALLKKINPNTQLGKLSDKEASVLARKMNCEAAIIGRYFVSQKNGRDNALIQAEGVDVLRESSILLRSQYADIDADIFNLIRGLAVGIAAEFEQRLPPISAKDANRDAQLEKFIARLENPPKGFFDEFNVEGMQLKPGFDIDNFEYDVEVTPEQKVFQFQYIIWGKIFKPIMQPEGMQCTVQKCTIDSKDSVLVLRKDKSSPVFYTIRFHQKDGFDSRKGGSKLVQSWWVTAGYPYAFSMPLPNNSNPNYVDADSGFPLSKMRGFGFLEGGVTPGRWQLPKGFEWSLQMQFMYASGNFPEYYSGGTNAFFNMMSAGGGGRISREFQLGKWYSLSPLLAINLHYQRFFRQSPAGALNTFAPALELGLNHAVIFSTAARWRLLISTIGGIFFYSSQNLSYVRMSLGVEYAL